jgi:eukaryotic-like serine/threonine-protein kinase
MTTSRPRSCPNCGESLSDSTSLGLCPKCLLAQYLTPTEDRPSLVPDPAAVFDNGVKFVAFGDYDLLEEIGRGGMGVVYRARQRGLDRIAALKMVLPSRLTSAIDLQRFRLEAETVARLEHPHILPIYEVGEIHGQPYYTTKYLEGGSLAQRRGGRTTNDTNDTNDRAPFTPEKAAAHPSTGGEKRTMAARFRSTRPGASPIRVIRTTIRGSPSGQADVQLFLKICHAVAYAHACGVLHRDLKPANILLDGDGEPYVADFGLARMIENESDLTLSQAMIGTPTYAAPEQLREGTRHLTTAADVYSLGAILYELLAGRPPLRGPTTAETVRQVIEEEPRPLRALNPAVDRDLEAICRKCLEKDPRQRYANAGELARELEHYLANEPIQARALDTVTLVWRWCRRRRAAASVIGTIALAVVAVAVVASVAALRIAQSREAELREGYFNRIALASSLIEKGDIPRAKEILIEFPERYRHWEWGHLMYRCHQNILSITAHADIEVEPIQQFREHIRRVRTVQFDASDSCLATSGSDGSVKVWNAADGSNLAAIGGEEHPVTAFAFNPTRDLLAVAFPHRSIELWHSQNSVAEPHSKTLRGSPNASERSQAWSPSPLVVRLKIEPARHLSWAPDGTRLVAAGRRGFSVIEIESGSLLGQRTLGEDIENVWFTADGKRLVVQSGSEARLYDPDGLVERGGIHPPAGAGMSLFLDPLAQRWVTIDSEGVVCLWQNAEHRTRLNRIQGIQAGEVRRVFFSPDGQRFCTGGEDGTARVWDAATGAELFAVPSRVYRARFSSDGRLLATLGAEDTAHLWDLEGRRERLALRGHAEIIETFDLSRDGHRLATASRDGIVKLWSTRLGRETLPERSWIWGVSISPDGSQIVTAPWGTHEFTIWDAASGRRRLTVDTLVHGVTWSNFSPDGRRLVTIGHDKIGRVWDTRTGELLLSLTGHSRCSDWVTYSPDGKRIAIPCRDGTVRLWDAETGHQTHCLEAGTNRVYGAFFTPEGQRLFVTGFEGLSIWEVASGRRLPPLPEFPNLQGPPTWIIFGPEDNQFSVTGSDDSSVRICDLRTGRELGRFDLRGLAGGWAFGLDASRVVIPAVKSWGAGYDTGTAGLELWDTRVRRRVLALEGHVGALRRAFCGGDGRRVLSLSWDLELRQWEAFPWSSPAYPGADGESFRDRVERYARTYWQQRLEAEEAPLPVVRVKPARQILWPARNARAGPDQLDLGSHYNALLCSTFVPIFTQDDSDNDLSALPTGTVALGEVNFDLRGVIQLRRGGVELLEKPFQVAWERCPVRIENIHAGRKLRQLHVLHGTAGAEPPGKTVARWLWHYAPDPSQPSAAGSRTVSSTTSGTENTIAFNHRKDDGDQMSPHLVVEVRYGEDVFDWWFKPGEEETDQPGPGRVVWRGSNPRASAEGQALRLYLRTWDNPRPDAWVESLTYESALTDSAPFLIAVTVE